MPEASTASRDRQNVHGRLATRLVERLLRAAHPPQRRGAAHPADRGRETFGAVDYGAPEAGVAAMAVPCVVLFLAPERHYVQAFTTGAIRG
jgi:hypothetical protein